MSRAKNCTDELDIAFESVLPLNHTRIGILMLRTALHRKNLTEMAEKTLSVTHQVTAFDQFGKRRAITIVGEFPLTIKVNGQDIVTLMTLGTDPEELAIGYLRNQRLITGIREIESIDVEPDMLTVSIETSRDMSLIDFERGMHAFSAKTGCGQGTIFSCTLDVLYEMRFQNVGIEQSILFNIFKQVRKYNVIYKRAGSVHGCGLFRGAEALVFIEDVSRNNAMDVIAGKMMKWSISGEDKVLYTTGRLTSEIVIKAANMRVPVLISRSGVTHRALELAQDLGMTMVGRAKGNRYLVFSGEENVIYDSVTGASSSDIS
jgi:FdhD protein